MTDYAQQMPVHTTVSGLDTYTFPTGGVAVEILGEPFNQGRLIEDGPINNPAARRMGVDALHEQGYTGQGVRVCSFAGDLTIAVNKGYGLKIEDTFDPNTPDKKIPASGLGNESHALLCNALINDQSGNILPVAGNARLLVSNASIPQTGMRWALSKDAQVLYYAFSAFAPLQGRIYKSVKDRGAVLVVSGGNDFGAFPLNGFCTRDTVNVAQFRASWGETDPFVARDYNENDIGNTLPNASGAVADFTVASTGLSRHIHTDGTIRGIQNAGTSMGAAFLAGLYALLNEKYPGVPGRVLTNFLKLRSKGLPANY